MKEIDVLKGYKYLPDHNLLVNSETFEKYKSYFQETEVTLPAPRYSKDKTWQDMTKIYQVTFLVTKECNLRCVYCQYNDNYSSEWNLTNEFMEFDTAKRTLDYFCDLIKDRSTKEFNICFYGGEPLLAFDLIKQIVDYSKKVFFGWSIQYFMTTNGTLLKDETIDYLIKENFSLLISLDGSQEVHDAKRVFPSGKGTFSSVWQALEKIKSKNPDFFKTVRINAVQSYDRQTLLDMYNFFTKNDMLAKTSIAYAPVSSRNTDYFERFPFDREKYKKYFDIVIEKIIEKLSILYDDKDLEDVLNPFEFEIYNNYLTKPTFNSGPKSILGGACDLFSRPFIDTKGNIHICERINHTFPIGDVFKGYDFDRIDSIKEEFIELRKKSCLGCEVNHLCNPCFCFFNDNGFFSIDKELCTRLKEWNIELLQTAVRINERIAKQESKGAYKFHQFIQVHEGPVNSAIIDILKGDIYQVPTQTIRLFKEGDYEQIGEFITDAEGLDLIIKTNPNAWIPDTKAWDKRVRDELTTVDYVLLHIEDRIDPAVIMKMVKKFKIVSIKYYGQDKIEDSLPGIDIIYAQKDFEECRKSAVVAEGNFNKIEKDSYQFNKVCNTCWGHKLAITKDEKIRPCIYSDIVIAYVGDIDKKETIDKILSYWFITKDRVERCKDCEFRYVCSDCREIAQRENNGNLLASNPNCNYNPYTGEWKS